MFHRTAEHDIPITAPLHVLHDKRRRGRGPRTGSTIGPSLLAPASWGSKLLFSGRSSGVTSSVFCFLREKTEAVPPVPDPFHETFGRRSGVKASVSRAEAW